MDSDRRQIQDVEMISESRENLHTLDECEDGDDDEDVDEWTDFVEYPDYPYDEPGPSYGALSPSERDNDPEYFDYKCLMKTDVEQLFNVAVERLTSEIYVSPSIAKVLLNRNSWEENGISNRYKNDCHQLLVDSGLKPKEPVSTQTSRITECTVCCRTGVSPSEIKGLACGHSFCFDCWLEHCKTQLMNGVATGIACMAASCTLLAPEDFILTLLNSAKSSKDLRVKYQNFAFRDYVDSHPHLKMCVGADCPTIIQGKTKFGKRVECKLCGSAFCFLCGQDYHAPADCETIKKWLVKCADDSETANYISAHTKDCPQCHSCIEKNGGCNHMQCTKCKHHFCWMCLGDWKAHGSEYYECSRYKENPAVSNEVANVKARRALEKYLHYYERWENHNKSLMLEQQLKEKIRKRIDEKVQKHEGTWIDWQYLYDAASLLTKCRYTLQYTYPYAFFLPNGGRRDLFEYQQGQLEKAIEELSWKVERAESTDRGDIEAQMYTARCKRLTLLQDFFSESAAAQWLALENNTKTEDKTMAPKKIALEQSNLKQIESPSKSRSAKK